MTHSQHRYHVTSHRSRQWAALRDESQHFAETSSVLDLLCSPACGVMHKLGVVFEAQFLFDLAAMSIHRFDAEMQQARNLLRLFALPNQTVNFKLSIRQFSNG